MMLLWSKWIHLHLSFRMQIASALLSFLSVLEDDEVSEDLSCPVLYSWSIELHVRF